MIPLPGCTSSPSSVKTITPGFKANLAVFAGISLLETEDPIPPSVEPIASNKVISCISRSPSLISELHITPLEIIAFMDDKS